MKKLLFLLFITYSLNAQTVRRVILGMNLQTEMNNATVGDIIMVEAGNYGAITFTKQLTLIGPGYGNSQTATPGSAILGIVSFNSGSSGSLLTGFQTGDINVSTSNIVVMRNYCGTIKVGINDAANFWQAISNNVIIKQNFATRLEILASSSPGQVSNFSVKNNLFSTGFHLEGIISGEIINNTFDANLNGTTFCGSLFFEYYTSINISSVLIKNNIFTNLYTGGFTCVSSNTSTLELYSNITQTIFKNNIIHLTPFNGQVAANFPFNLSISDLNTLYQGYPNNPNVLAFDARNQLAANSPAKGTGEAGTDCGAFGGDEPYVLSGVPYVPSIYELKVPQTIGQNGTLNIQIKAKTNN